MDKAKKENPRESLTLQVLEAIKENTLPWRKPWSSLYPTERAKNPVTSTIYRGGNALFLYLAMLDRSYPVNRWVTQKQAEGKGWEIKEDAKPVPIEVWDTVPFWKTELGKKELSVADGSFKLTDIKKYDYKKNTVVLKNKTEIDAESIVFNVKSDAYSKDSVDFKHARAERRWNVPFAVVYSVYNLTEVNGVPDEFYPVKREVVLKDHDINEHNQYVLAMREGLIADGLTYIPNGSKAAYNPALDAIQMPDLKLFHTVPDHDSTLAHEMGHATAPRVLRDTKDYATEELVAEMASLFVSIEYGVPMPSLDNHVAYLKNWGESLEDPKNKDMLFKAAAEAGKAVDCLSNLACKVQPELMANVDRQETVISTKPKKGRKSKAAMG
jgi:antirestriction protein ArdC